MKNVYLIPTDKPTGIFDSGSGLQFSIINKVRYGELKGFHLYITSEEISGLENDIWVCTEGRVWKWESTMAINLHKKPKKVILTTDPDLIVDGVQKIDDTFLEWLAKNPTCEYVEVVYNPNESGKLFAYIGYNISNGNFHFSTVPFTEPKSETSYSEEEVFKLIDKAFHMYASSHRQDAKEWFEQNKKK
jgi:hypothetical protein